MVIKYFMKRINKNDWINLRHKYFVVVVSYWQPSTMIPCKFQRDNTLIYLCVLLLSKNSWWKLERFGKLKPKNDHVKIILDK